MAIPTAVSHQIHHIIGQSAARMAALPSRLAPPNVPGTHAGGADGSLRPGSP